MLKVEQFVAKGSYEKRDDRAPYHCVDVVPEALPPVSEPLGEMWEIQR